MYTHDVEYVKRELKRFKIVKIISKNLYGEKINANIIQFRTKNKDMFLCFL